YAIADALSKVGKWSMLVLLVSGVLVLWLKWDFVVPNHWFWAKMGFVAAMLVLIGINEASHKKARAGDAAAAARSKMAGQLTGLAFIGGVISAVLAFN